MASIAKRHPVAHAHAHCRRVKAGARLELTAPIASAEKPTQQTHQENIPKASQKAKINRKGTEFHAKRTIVVEYLKQMNKWKKQFKEDKFFRYRVISRRYLRKLSLQPSPPQIETQRRKISWGEQVEILVFDSELEPSIISENQSFLETLIKPH